MLTLLSPAKKLAVVETGSVCSITQTEPVLINKAQELADLMKKMSVAAIAKLMHLSQDLAQLNYERYQGFKNNADNAHFKHHTAVFLFQGDVYKALKASLWQEKELEYAQKHLRILSGLYGFLKPLDGIQPYRLEMGLRLANPYGTTLYDFWGDLVTQAINQELKVHNNPLVLNLASAEYFKVIHLNKLQYPCVSVHFYENKNQQLKIVGIHAKKARGLMAQFIVDHQIDGLEPLKSFSQEGYCFDAQSSSAACLNFIRVH